MTRTYRKLAVGAASLRDVADAKSDQITTMPAAVDCQDGQDQIAFFPANPVKHPELHVDNESENGFVLSVRPASEALLCRGAHLVLHQPPGKSY